MALALLFTFKENVNNRFLEESKNTSTNLHMHQTKVSSIFLTLLLLYNIVLWCHLNEPLISDTFPNGVARGSLQHQVRFEPDGSFEQRRQRLQCFGCSLGHVPGSRGR